MSIINSGVGVILLYQALHLSQLWGALGSNLILLQQYIEGVANTEANAQGCLTIQKVCLPVGHWAVTQECIGSVADICCGAVRNTWGG